MPRINVTEEEPAFLEKIRTKQAQTLGYNEGLEIAAIQIETMGWPDCPDESDLVGYRRLLRATSAKTLRELKRDLT